MTRNATAIPVEDLRRGESLVFEGADFGGVETSFFLVRARPGCGPTLHTHPYQEVWVLEEGEASFTVGYETLTVGPGSVVVAPAGVPHTFTNVGEVPLRMICLHPRARMETACM
jgi:mannose-6-phosphate isomerase-like protein (cupin superfamily)